MPAWSIKIVPVDPSKPDGSAQFVPQNAPVGQPLATWNGDLVTWNNTTGTAHWPWPTDANYKPLSVQSGDLGYMSDDIAAGQGSRPIYSINLPAATTPTPYTIYYYCQDHPDDPNERGTIVVTNPP